MTHSPGLLPRISDYVHWWAEKSPEREACVVSDVRWSYRELSERVKALAGALAGAGVRAGDRVATLLTPHPEYLVAFLATASIGGIWVGLNPKYRRSELEHVVRDSQPRVVLARTRLDGRDYREDLEALRAAATTITQLVTYDQCDLPETVTFEAFVAGASTTESVVSDRRPEEREPCLLVYTSGSTGVPKGALIHHTAISLFSLEQNRIWPIQDLRVLNYFPINHIGCVIDISMPCIVAGGAIVFLEQFEPELSLALMEREKITLWGGVPSVFQLQLAVPNLERFDLSHVELIVWEGAGMPEDLVRSLLAFERPLATNYSMTEATGIAVLEPSRDLEVLSASVGFPFPGCDIRIMKADGTEADPGESGEVWVRSPYLFVGYWKNASATGDAMTSDGFFRTGDVAEFRPDGRMRIVGRIKEMFKSGGYNVYPREVEAVIESHPAVAQAAVVGVSDPLWQEVGVAYIAVKGPVETDELMTWCKERLANYKVPKRIVIEADLPLLPIGKVDRAALKRRGVEQALT